MRWQNGMTINTDINIGDYPFTSRRSVKEMNKKERLVKQQKMDKELRLKIAKLIFAQKNIQTHQVWEIVDVIATGLQDAGWKLPEEVDELLRDIRLERW